MADNLELKRKIRIILSKLNVKQAAKELKISPQELRALKKHLGIT